MSIQDGILLHQIHSTLMAETPREKLSVGNRDIDYRVPLNSPHFTSIDVVGENFDMHVALLTGFYLTKCLFTFFLLFIKCLVIR
jgi:hypothetical protein